MSEEFKFGTWYPIESAPKDRDIIVCGGAYQYDAETYPSDYPIDEACMARWSSEEKWFGGYGSEYDGAYWLRPTHWMPKPTPPPPSNGDRKPEDQSTAECLNQSLPSSPTVERGE